MIPDEFVPVYVHYRRDKALRRAVKASSNDAELLFLRGLAHARANHTAGRVEDFDLPDLAAGMADPTPAVDALVEQKLWIADDDGWIIRSYAKWNPAGASSSAGSLGNHKRWHAARGIMSPDCSHCQAADTPDIAPTSPRLAPDVGGDVLEESRGEEKKPSTPAAADEQDDTQDDTPTAGPARPDVDRLLDLLDELVTANGHRTPARTRGNRDAIRLLLDRDGYPEAEVEHVMRWATGDEFWRANIRSAAKFRQQYPTLAIKAGRRPARPLPSLRLTPAADYTDPDDTGFIPAAALYD